MIEPDLKIVSKPSKFNGTQRMFVSVSPMRHESAE